MDLLLLNRSDRRGFVAASRFGGLSFNALSRSVLRRIELQCFESLCPVALSIAAPVAVLTGAVAMWRPEFALWPALQSIAAIAISMEM